MTTIDTADLADAVAPFGDWLAADITTWIRNAENRGTQFPDTLTAVQRALAAINVASVLEGELS